MEMSGTAEKHPKETDSNEIMEQFKEMSRELDDKHDRHERIVKISRDITIESKRIIFQLHSIDVRKENKDRILAESNDRLRKLCASKFSLIAKELAGKDVNQYIRAYSAGVQEFIEALSFYEFSGDSEKLSSWKNITENFLTFAEESLHVIPTEFMLGLQDTTGELMRKAVNSLGSGDVDQTLRVCDILRSLHIGFSSIHNHHNREWNRKMYTLYQSLLKTEYVCYCIKVRGKETAKWSANNPLQPMPAFEDEDEGVY